MMKNSLRVTVLMDAACLPDTDPDFSPDVRDPSTEYHVVTTLKELGHSVSILGVWNDVEAVVRGLKEQDPQLVFNLTEQFRDDRRQDKNVAGLLELMQIPFTGTGSTGLMLSRSKSLSKRLLSTRKIRVPGFIVLAPGKRPRIPKALTYPMVVKPVYEDGSDGIFNASLARDEATLRERARVVHERWKQPAIAEEFIEGRELYVSVLGNRRLKVLPAREMFYDHNAQDGPVLATYKVKWDEAYREKWKITFGFAELDPELEERIARICKRAYRVLEFRDWGRIDVRVTPDNRIVVLEGNANGDIAYGEEVAEAAEKAGIPYTALIDNIVNSALRRHHLS